MLELRNVVKIYKPNVRALDNVSVKLGSKGLLVILGKSGCGKTTFLNIAGGLDKPTSGEVIINGVSSNTFKGSDFDAYRNTYVGFVFQEFNLIDDISVFDNIDMTLKIQEKSADVISVDEALSLVGLSNLGYRKPTELSGGQRQRVAIARALLKKPEIIFADEPTGALDQSTGEDVFDVLKRISRDKLVVVVTHDKGLAYTYGDRIIEISDGRVINDVVNRGSDGAPVKKLCEGVIAVAAGSVPAKEMLNAEIKPGEVNYIGISHDKDRIALAYPDTVDSFYQKPQTNAFEQTQETDITDSQKEFKLSKGKLKISDAVKMARASLKNRKRRYKFLTFFAVICFTFLTLAVIINSVDSAELLKNNVYGDHSLDIVSVSRAGENGGSHYFPEERGLSEQDIGRIKTVMETSYHAEKLYYSFTPSFAIVQEEAAYTLSRFNGIFFNATPVQLGMQMRYGSAEAKSHELIISDFAASELLRKGFLGFDKNGAYSIWYLTDMAELVGARLFIYETGKYHTIAGIFKTDYKDFEAISDVYAMDKKHKELTAAFIANKEFLYSGVFVSQEFGDMLSYSFYGEYVQMRIAFITHDMYSIAFASGIMETMKYSESVSDNLNFIYVHNTTSLDAPKTLAENQIVIGMDMVRRLITELYDADDNEILNHQVFKTLMNEGVVISFNTTNAFILEEIFYIAGITEENAMLYFNSDFASSMKQARVVTSVYVNRGARIDFSKRVNTLVDQGFIFGSPRIEPGYLHMLDGQLTQMRPIFTWVSVFFLVFTFLIVLNFMSVSVRRRQKEIAVYRIIGAKAYDIAKMFLAEGMFMAVKITAWASVLSFLLSLFINNMMSAFMVAVQVDVNIIAFKLWYPFIILAFSALFIALASLLPVMSVIAKKPGEAVKMF